jgi:hypothetical protein
VKTPLLERTRPADLDEAPVWGPVSADRPCPVCGATAGCATAQPEGLACCRSTVSVWPVAGGGWLHVLSPGG